MVHRVWWRTAIAAWRKKQQLQGRQEGPRRARGREGLAGYSRSQPWKARVQERPQALWRQRMRSRTGRIRSGGGGGRRLPRRRASGRCCCGCSRWVGGEAFTGIGHPAAAFRCPCAMSLQSTPLSACLPLPLARFPCGLSPSLTCAPCLVHHPCSLPPAPLHPFSPRSSVPAPRVSCNARSRNPPTPAPPPDHPRARPRSAAALRPLGARHAAHPAPHAGPGGEARGRGGVCRGTCQRGTRRAAGARGAAPGPAGLRPCVRRPACQCECEGGGRAGAWVAGREKGCGPVGIGRCLGKQPAA